MIGGIVSELTQRQIEVLQAYADGYRRGELANYLGISENTLRSHQKQIARRLNLIGCEWLRLVTTAYRKGWISWS